MKESVAKMKENTPFSMFIIHKQGTAEKPSNTLPITLRGRSKLPNMKWAIENLSDAKYRLGKVQKAIFYENGQEIGIYENGRYFGKYQNYE